MFENAKMASTCPPERNGVFSQFPPSACPPGLCYDFPDMEDKQFFLSPDLTHRLAAIDVGTNSIRLIVAEPLRDGTYRILDEEKETTRLGKHLASTGRLDPEAVERSLETLKRLKQIAAGFQIRELRVIATCAVREATDGPEFCRRAKDEIGLEIEVISSKKEAHLAFISVSRSFALRGKNVAVADIGGGSTELILASGDMIESVCSTPLGAVRVTEQYGGEQGLIGEGFDQMIEGIDRELRRRTKKAVLEPHLLIGSGGTFTTLAEIVMNSKGQVGLPLRGFEITRAEVRHTLDRLRKLPLKMRRSVAGLSPDRADIIVAGVAIIDRIMHCFNLNFLQIHDRGVRDGLLLAMIDKDPGHISKDPHDQDAAIERFAAGCGCDLKHGRHVAKLAGLIFSQLAEAFNMQPSDRTLLEAAARLQDVGYLINYEQHHKHSYHLILHSRLAEFQPNELELIANIARYHRGSEPKKKHENYSRLSSDDRKRVRQLAAILRLAGGFDRSNTQQVQGIDVQVSSNHGEICMRVHSEQQPDLDIWGARRRSEPFENAFEIKLQIEWQPPQAASQAS
jgi:exopolyphosphatase/guanosine-5'-triphosphate,3'-diphosphate pyrophosphatase